jgi:hypothetical protein
MANEVRSQRLMQFLQITSANQALLPFAKFPYIIREIAKAMDLDPDKVSNNMEEAARQAAIVQQQSPQQPPQQGPQPGAPAVPGVQDMTGAGGGNIGIGAVPVPGEQGFSAAPPQPQQPRMQ